MTNAIISPRKPTIRPLTSESPESIAISVMPNSASRKNSAGPNVSTIGRSSGISESRNSPPITPPSPDAPNDAPSALPASPCLVIGRPSTIVAASGPVPGTPNRMLGTEPPVCTTECIAIRNSAPATASMPNTNGITSTMPSLPPSPGIAPKNMPIGTATASRNR